MISPEGGGVFQIRIGTDGRVLGYSRPDPGGQAQVSFVQVSSNPTVSRQASEGAKIDRELARQLAHQAFERRLGKVTEIEFGKPDTELDGDDEQSMLFTWFGKSETNQDLRLRYTVTVTQDQLAAESIRAELDNEVANEEYPLTSVIRIVVYREMGVVAFFLSVYSLYLYFLRTRQGEVSHRRNILLGLLVALSFTVVAVLSSVDSIATQLNKGASDPLFILMLVAISFVYAFVGAYCGLMWGSGEGEVREAYPGKLTSVDALVLGRWFSQNVATSMVIGTALGLWLLLVTNAVQWPWRESPQFGALQSTQAMITCVRFSGLLILLTPIISALTVAILGLLVPITYAWRWFESKRLRIVFLTVLATLGCLWFGLQIYPIQAGIGVTVVTAVFLVVSFLYFDLLTTIATISAWNAVTNLVNLGANRLGVLGLSKSGILSQVWSRVLVREATPGKFLQLGSYRIG